MANTEKSVPKEYQRFQDLLRKVVKPMPKPASAPASSDKDQACAAGPTLPVSSA